MAAGKKWQNKNRGEKRHLKTFIRHKSKKYIALLAFLMYITLADVQICKYRREYLMLNIIRAIDWELEQINKELLILKRDRAIPQKTPVRARKRRGNIYYFSIVRNNGIQKETYLGKANSDKLLNLIKQSYKAEMLKVLMADRDLMMKTKALYQPHTTENIMKRLSPCLADYPFQGIFEERLEEMKRWAEADYTKNTSPFSDRKSYAKDGRRVRSISECIIYNALLDAGIFFRYDPVLELESPDPQSEGLNRSESPDFQIICMDGSFILIEHAGKLSEKWYSDDLARKLQLYHYNGYVPGVNMFITANDKDGGFDTTSVAQLIETIRWKVYEL